MRLERRVRILATLGPASASKDVISRLFEAGADVFRINMSHTPHEELHRLCGVIREIEAEKGRPIGILADLQGPKLRIGEIAGGSTTIESGATFILDEDARPGDGGRAHLPHPEIFASVAAGHTLLIDDGRLRLTVVEASRSRIVADVAVGGVLSSRKGVSLPDTLLPVSAMTDKDRRDLEAAVRAQVDWIALSFVQRKEDMDDARELLNEFGVRIALMAKIEKPSAIDDLAGIIGRSDGLMIARGDLGVELPLERVPGLQKRIMREARKQAKPVVVATQMLESMIQSPVPTRAEVSDVANAVFEGADCVMLSAESAVGKYAVEAVRMMARVVNEVEGDPIYQKSLQPKALGSVEETTEDALSAAAKSIAFNLGLAAIVCFTSTGTTALRAARQRPLQPIFALTPNQRTARRLALVWGIRCFMTPDPRDIDQMVHIAQTTLQKNGVAAPGQKVIIAAGMPFGRPGATNMLRITVMRDEDAASA